MTLLYAPNICSLLTPRSKACKKELRQKIMASINQTSGDTTLIPSANSSSPSTVPISTANVNAPNIGGPVGGMSGGGNQNGMGSGSNLQQPPPPIWRILFWVFAIDWLTNNL